jgi:hypothetical protein
VERNFRSVLNYGRSRNCSHLAAYAATGFVQFVELFLTNTSVELTIEIIYGVNIYHIRIVFPSNSTNAIDTDFRLIDTVHGPCESAPQEQLAVSSEGAHCSAVKYVALLRRQMLKCCIRTGTQPSRAGSRAGTGQAPAHQGTCPYVTVVTITRTTRTLRVPVLGPCRGCTVIV